MNEARILVVDDDDDIRSNYKDIFDGLGYRTDTARDGAGALRLLKSTNYDVALLDYTMPGMDGARLHKEIAKLHPGLAAIMVTACTETDLARVAADGGIQHILQKPVDLGKLLPLVAEMSSKSTGYSSPRA